jgi:hypothetical protein
MKKAKEVIANNSGLKFKKRLEQSMDEMKETVKVYHSFTRNIFQYFVIL